MDVGNIILVEDPRGKVYLFHYEVNDDSNDNTSLGAACLAERQGGQAGEPVIIDHRSIWDKLSEKAMANIVEVGGEEFRRKFLVRCSRPDIAAATVTHSVEEVLLRPTSSLDWDRVFIAGGRVLVTVTLRLQPEEWDELLGMARRLRAALP
jgi:hypothetical protein